MVTSQVGILQGWSSVYDMCGQCIAKPKTAIVLAPQTITPNAPTLPPVPSAQEPHIAVVLSTKVKIAEIAAGKTFWVMNLFYRLFFWPQTHLINMLGKEHEKLIKKDISFQDRCGLYWLAKAAKANDPLALGMLMQIANPLDAGGFTPATKEVARLIVQTLMPPPEHQEPAQHDPAQSPTSEVAPIPVPAAVVGGEAAIGLEKGIVPILVMLASNNIPGLNQKVQAMGIVMLTKMASGGMPVLEEDAREEAKQALICLIDYLSCLARGEAPADELQASIAVAVRRRMDALIPPEQPSEDADAAIAQMSKLTQRVVTSLVAQLPAEPDESAGPDPKLVAISAMGWLAGHLREEEEETRTRLATAMDSDVVMATLEAQSSRAFPSEAGVEPSLPEDERVPLIDLLVLLANHNSRRAIRLLVGAKPRLQALHDSWMEDPQTQLAAGGAINCLEKLNL